MFFDILNLFDDEINDNIAPNVAEIEMNKV